MSWQERLRAERDEAARWINQKNAELRRFAGKAEARGREIYAEGIRTGQNFLARTPSELRELGIAGIQGRLPQAAAEMAVRRIGSAQAPRPGPPKPRTPAPKPKVDMSREFRAGVSGFVDEASFGAADRVLAAGDAVKQAIQRGDATDLADDYRSGMEQKRADDAYDDQNHAAARNTGRVAGFAATVAPFGAPAVGRAMLAMGPRMAKTARAMASGSRYGLDTKGLTQMSAVTGASAGMMEQAAVDTVMNRRGTARDYLRAGVGGAAGGVATRWMGPIGGGAVGGGSSSAMDDALSGREISVGDMIRAGHGSALLGGIGNTIGTYRAATASSGAKGDMGELLTRTKVAARGSGPVHGVGKALKLSGGGHTFTDARGYGPGGRDLIFEAKMGPNAKMTPRQRQAQAQYGDDYYVDGWRFSDIGKANALALSPLGQQREAWSREPGRE